MTKNQKKPTVLSMGGVLPKKSKLPHTPTKTIVESQDVRPTRLKRPNLREHTKTGTQILKNLSRKPKRGFKFKISSTLSYIKDRIFYILIPLFIAGLYLFNINHFPPFRPSDAAVDYNSLSDITSVLFLPVKVCLFLLYKLHSDFQMNTRLLSAALMLISVFCFYKLLSSWVSWRMSVLATLLYSTSSWALFQVRQDESSAFMLAFIPVLLYLGQWFIRTDSRIARIFIAIALVQFIFIPGAIWFLLVSVILGAIYFGKNLPVGIFILPLLAVSATLAGYAWLIYVLSLDSISLFAKTAGLGIGGLPSLSIIKANIVELPSQLFYGGLNDSSMWLPTTPIIDWVSAVFLLAGFVYLYRSVVNPVRKTIMSLFFLLALVLIFINGALYISLLLPLVYIMMALGITYLTDRWLSIFPNNPLARAFGLALVFAIVFLVCAYHVERYFIGWPKTDDYHQIYKS